MYYKIHNYTETLEELVKCLVNNNYGRRNMELEYESQPRTGQSFRVTIKRFVGPATIESYLGDKLLSRKDCPDPPCHDMFMIPSSATGSMLTVVAVDANGDRKEQSFTIYREDMLGRGEIA